MLKISEVLTSMNTAPATKVRGFQLGLIAACLLSCSCTSTPTPGPDKTGGGAVLGGLWGAGTGAIVGHQVGAAGEGLAVGLGLGAVSGALTGMGYDLTETQTAKLGKELEALEEQNTENTITLAKIQQNLDSNLPTTQVGTIAKVLFDPQVTSLRVGAIQELEPVANLLRRLPNPHQKIIVRGHTDDEGSLEANTRIGEARARAVAALLSSRGVPIERIEIQSYGSRMPLASNVTVEGRQLNRRVEIVLAEVGK